MSMCRRALMPPGNCIRYATSGRTDLTSAPAYTGASERTNNSFLPGVCYARTVRLSRFGEPKRPDRGEMPWPGKNYAASIAVRRMARYIAAGRSDVAILASGGHDERAADGRALTHGRRRVPPHRRAPDCRPIGPARRAERCRSRRVDEHGELHHRLSGDGDAPARRAARGARRGGLST